MDNLVITPVYGYVEVPRPKYWYENGAIHCDTGTTLSYGDQGYMTEREAWELALMGGIVLGEKPV
jgi:hypothetical protein